MTFKENLKTGLKSKVDKPALIIVTIGAIAGWIIAPEYMGGYTLCALYVFNAIYRIGFFKNALNKYVTEKEYREILKLPKLKN
jgi:hypothetical protein